MHDVDPSSRRVQMLSGPSCCHLDIRGPEACICTHTHNWPGLPWLPDSQPHCDLTLREVHAYTSLLPRDIQTLESLQQLARIILILRQPAAPVDFPLKWYTPPGSLTTSPTHSLVWVDLCQHSYARTPHTHSRHCHQTHRPLNPGPTPVASTRFHWLHSLAAKTL